MIKYEYNNLWISLFRLDGRCNATSTVDTIVWRHDVNDTRGIWLPTIITIIRLYELKRTLFDEKT